MAGEMRTVVVTGGAGYVGSHCAKAFAQAGWRVVTVDNLSRGFADAVRFGPLVEADIADGEAMANVFTTYQPDLVAHFAAFAYVGESVEDPAIYYRNNTLGTFALLESMRAAKVANIIFSSTCATYGVPIEVPITEAHPQHPINPYGWSKLAVERMLADFGQAYGLNSMSLRYFNAAGCDPDGELGERHDPETHVIPLAIEAALNENGSFTVNGSEFATPDGTAVRDFIHVCDLARAHVLAGEHLLANGGVHALNLGTGAGTSVLEIVTAVERLTGRRIRILGGPARPGDPPALVAGAQKAQTLLGWRPTQSDIDTIVSTALAWVRSRLADPGSAERLTAQMS
jgi:UDP-arabinose 4-epimerase